METKDLFAHQIPSLIANKNISAEELVQAHMDKIHQDNQRLGAMLWLNEEALEQARRVDRGEVKGKLSGVPVIIKDNFCIKGMRTTAASRILDNFIPPYTAHCVQRLIDEGAIILGKANMDEFAMGSSNENSFYGVCKNPWNEEYVPGGSSGGSAAAVAADFAPLSLGSDTGGSIRQPASFCGVVGIKPTYGSVSRFGMIAFASSLDQAGTFGKSVRDAALALEVMINKDGRDGTNIQVPFESLGVDQKIDLKSIKIGMPKQYWSIDCDSAQRRALESLAKDLKSLGATLVEVDLPHTSYAIPVYYLIASSEASSNLSRYDGVRYGLRDIERENGQPVKELSEFYKLTRSRGFGDEVKRRILLGTFSLSAGYFDDYYIKACKTRRLIANDFVKGFEHCDFMIGPVATSPAFKIGEKTRDPLEMYNNDILTTPASLAGLPSMSLPLTMADHNRPVGLQVIAPAFADDKMIMFANSLEEIINFKGASIGS